MRLVGWRDVPNDNSCLGQSVKPTEPFHQQVFIGKGDRKLDADEFDRRLYIHRKTISRRLYNIRERPYAGYHPVSNSRRTMVHQRTFLADRLGTLNPRLPLPVI